VKGPRRAVLAVLLAVALPGTAPAQPPTLDAVLTRAAAYVAGFERQLSGIVAEETYVQREIPGTTRTLRSDFLLVRPPGLDRWVHFRDVFEVDGSPVRDRQERLSALFQQPASDALEQARRIVMESARFNLGDVERTTNSPVFPLRVLERGNQWRFRFSRVDAAKRQDESAADAGLPDTPNFRVSTEVWIVRFRERETPTLVRDPNHNWNVLSSGRLWIEPSTGRVLMSDMTWDHPEVRATMTVSYQSEPLLGMLVPVEMRERYEDRRTHARIRHPTVEGTATYSRFRRFQVGSDGGMPPAP
jgi:hypothetical protein